jgi:hypothetical protein
MDGRRALVLGAALAAAGVLLWRLRPETAPAQAPVDEPEIVSRLATWSPAPPGGSLARLAGYAWAAPLTAAGLLLGALSGARPHLHEGALVFADARGLAGHMLRWRGFSAATLGHAIVAVGQPSASLLAHELTHVRQAERFGPFFAPLYLAALVRYGYRHNPFERAAYLAGGGEGGRRQTV